MNGKISLYGVVDWGFAGAKPTQSFSPGFNFDVLDWTWGKIDFRVDLLTLGGVTTTPTATLSSFTGGAHLNGCKGRLCVGAAVRQLTNPANPKEPRIFNVALEWRFRK